MIIILFILLLFILLLLFLKKEERHPDIELIKEKFSYIDPKYKNIDIVHGKTGEGSYTIGKRKIVMCTNDPKSGERYDENTQMYVALHELAHVLTKNYDDHGPEFQRNFKYLLLEAQRKGVYRSVAPPSTYCT